MWKIINAKKCKQFTKLKLWHIAITYKNILNYTILIKYPNNTL